MADRASIGAGGVVALGTAGCLVHDDHGTTVLLRGRRWWSWSVGDEAARRIAAVALADAQVASKVDVAAAFGITTVTLWRWSTAAHEHGIAGVRIGRPGPKGAWKLTEEVVERIVALDRQGLSQRDIARRVGVSSYSVRQVQRARTADRSGPTSQDTAAAVGAQDVGPDDRPSPGRRIGHASVGAAGAPIPTSQRLPLAGLLLAVPALCASGLLQAVGEVAAGDERLEQEMVAAALLAVVGRLGGSDDTQLDLDDVARLTDHTVPAASSQVSDAIADLGKRVGMVVLLAARAHHHLDQDAIGVLAVGGMQRTVRRSRAGAPGYLDVPFAAGASPWDAVGAAVFVVTGEPSPQAADDVRRSIAEVRAAAGESLTVVFERPAWPVGLLADLPDATVVTCVTSPWCHGAAVQVSGAIDVRDVLDAVTDLDPSRTVPNPASMQAHEEVRRLEVVLAEGRAAIERNRGLPELAGMVAELEVALDQVRAQLEVAQLRAARLPPRVPAIGVGSGARRIDTDAASMAHVLRVVAADVVGSLERMMVADGAAGGGGPRDAVRGEGDRRAAVRRAVRSVGVADVVGRELRITLDAPRDPADVWWLSTLCERLNETATTYPGTGLVLRYGIGAASPRWPGMGGWG